MKKAVLFFLWALPLTACVGRQVRPPGEADLLFPHGRYQQEVAVNVTATTPAQNFDFDCIVQKGPEEMLFYGYNSFGFSLFKIKEKKGQPIEAEASVEQIKKNQDFFIKIFKLVRSIVSLRKSDPRLKGNQIQLQEDPIAAQIQFSDYDSLGVPLKMIVETPNQYKVTIKTTTYKLEKKVPGN